MGDRYFLSIICSKCKYTDAEVYFAPTCGFVDWKCPKCKHVVDLVERTGITAEMASNAAEIKNMMDDIIKGKQEC